MESLRRAKGKGSRRAKEKWARAKCAPRRKTVSCKMLRNAKNAPRRKVTPFSKAAPHNKLYTERTEAPRRTPENYRKSLVSHAFKGVHRVTSILSACNFLRGAILSARLRFFLSGAPFLCGSFFALGNIFARRSFPSQRTLCARAVFLLCGALFFARRSFLRRAMFSAQDDFLRNQLSRSRQFCYASHPFAECPNVCVHVGGYSARWP